MASRNYAQVAPTAATIALNAYIYGYGGHSLVTPHVALKRLWWTDERIDAKVTRPFVVSKLRGEERDFLDKPLAFGEGLTDDTYMEWILERAKRLFLILSEIGVPDQIFGCIDDSWDDDDLPIPLESIKSLELSLENDEALNKKFYDMQFVYLLRELKEGSHIDYGPKEHIPMEHVNTVPPAVYLQPYDRVHFPNRPDDVYMRRKFPLTDRDTGQGYGEMFTRDVRKAKALPHEHIAHAWATYTSEDAGFVLSDFVAEHTLRTFIDHRMPMQFSRVPASERPLVLMQWMHCLSDALASLHHRGVAHTQIRPSNIWIDKSNRIAFADVGTIATLQRNKKSPKTEAYDYAAPEQQISRSPVTLKSSSPPVSGMNAFGRLRKISSISTSETASSTSGSSGGSSTRANSFCNVSTPITPSSTDGRSSSLSTIRTTISSAPRGSIVPSPTSTLNFSRHVPMHLSSPTSPMSPTSGTTLLPLTTTSSIDPETLRDLPLTTPYMSDIYSLACIYLDILTFLVKGKNSEFLKFRSSSSNKDTSFHSCPDKLTAWLDLLEEDSARHADPVFRGVPSLLHLVRTMLAQNATLRPTALAVRDRIQAILVSESGAEKLCCAGREWSTFEPESLEERDDELSPFRSSRRRTQHKSDGDGFSSSTAADAADGTDEEAGERAQVAGSEGPDGASVRSTGVTSASAKKKKKKKKEKGGNARRDSSASTATTKKLSSWRTRFLRH